jgi:hypothetical protein
MEEMPQNSININIDKDDRQLKEISTSEQLELQKYGILINKALNELVENSNSNELDNLLNKKSFNDYLYFPFPIGKIQGFFEYCFKNNYFRELLVFAEKFNAIARFKNTNYENDIVNNLMTLGRQGLKYDKILSLLEKNNMINEIYDLLTNTTNTENLNKFIIETFISQSNYETYEAIYQIGNKETIEKINNISKDIFSPKNADFLIFIENQYGIENFFEDDILFTPEAFKNCDIKGFRFLIDKIPQISSNDDMVKINENISSIFKILWFEGNKNKEKSTIKDIKRNLLYNIVSIEPLTTNTVAYKFTNHTINPTLRESPYLKSLDLKEEIDDLSNYIDDEEYWEKIFTNLVSVGNCEMAKYILQKTLIDNPFNNKTKISEFFSNICKIEPSGIYTIFKLIPREFENIIIDEIGDKYKKINFENADFQFLEFLKQNNFFDKLDIGEYIVHQFTYNNFPNEILNWYLDNDLNIKKILHQNKINIINKFIFFFSLQAFYNKPPIIDSNIAEVIIKLGKEFECNFLDHNESLFFSINENYLTKGALRIFENNGLHIESIS